VKVSTWVLLAGALAIVAPEDALAGTRKAVQLTGTLNLNEANPSQLDLLPGIGPSAAQRIIAYRQRQPFRRIEELVKVKGFGKRKFDKLRPYLAVSGQTTLKAAGAHKVGARPLPPGARAG
jgi:competence protein ComEA